MRVPVAAAAAALALAGCQDLREYAGAWTGELSTDPALAHGFPAGTKLTTEVSFASRESIDFTVLAEPGWTAPVAFVPIRRAAGDVLADVQLPGEPLRSFFGFVQPGGAAPYLAVMSLYPEHRMELRLIRGPDEAYAVFTLKRRR